MNRVFRQEHGRHMKRRLQHVTRRVGDAVAPIMEALGQEDDMPATSKVQRRLAGMELARKRKGKPPVSEMGSLSTAQLTDFASTPEKALPKRKKKVQP